jgi:surface antigen
MSQAYNISQLKLFIKKYQGKLVADPLGFYKGQCVSLVKQWLKFNKWPAKRGNAIDWQDNDDKNYGYYKNTPKFIPLCGDLAIFDTGKYGHIGIVQSATDKSMKVFQQNDPIGSPATIKTYNYIKPRCIGFLRKL